MTRTVSREATSTPVLPDDPRVSEVLIAATRASIYQSLMPGLAHELSNVGQAMALGEPSSGELSDQEAEIVKALRWAGDRLNDATEAVRLLGLPKTEDEPAVIEEVLRTVHVWQRYQKRLPNVAVRLELAGVVRPIAMPKRDLQMVLLTLIRNAKESIGWRDDAKIVVAASRAGDHVLIRVEDNGPGIPPSVRDRIFQPFFTTRPEEHLGIGLSAARSLVERFGGTLDTVYKPEDSHGALFVVEVPLLPGEPNRRAN